MPVATYVTKDQKENWAQLDDPNVAQSLQRLRSATGKPWIVLETSTERWPRLFGVKETRYELLYPFREAATGTEYQCLTNPDKDREFGPSTLFTREGLIHWIDGYLECLHHRTNPKEKTL